MALKCNIIPVNDPGLFMVNTSTSSYIVHVVTDDLYDKEQVLLELCRAIVSLEKKGAIVTSAQEIWCGRPSSTGGVSTKQGSTKRQKMNCR